MTQAHIQGQPQRGALGLDELQWRESERPFERLLRSLADIADCRHTVSLGSLMTQRVILSVLLLLFCGSGAAEPTHKTVAVNPSALPKDVKTAPAPSGPANRLFGAVTSPAPLAARAIGSYARGCLAGGSSMAAESSVLSKAGRRPEADGSSVF